MVQAAWLYLEPIFGSEDIRNQIPVEGKMFTQVCSCNLPCFHCRQHHIAILHSTSCRIFKKYYISCDLTVFLHVNLYNLSSLERMTATFDRVAWCLGAVHFKKLLCFYRSTLTTKRLWVVQCKIQKRWWFYRNQACWKNYCSPNLFWKISRKGSMSIWRRKGFTFLGASTDVQLNFFAVFLIYLTNKFKINDGLLSSVYVVKETLMSLNVASTSFKNSYL